MSRRIAEGVLCLIGVVECSVLGWGLALLPQQVEGWLAAGVLSLGFGAVIGTLVTGDWLIHKRYRQGP